MDNRKKSRLFISPGLDKLSTLYLLRVCQIRNFAFRVKDQTVEPVLQPEVPFFRIRVLKKIDTGYLGMSKCVQSSVVIISRPWSNAKNGTDFSFSSPGFSISGRLAGGREKNRIFAE